MSVITANSSQSASSAIPLMTAEEFARQYGGAYVELVKGRVMELPMPFPKHGKICNRAAFQVTLYAETQDCGHVMTNDSFVQTGKDPDTIRGADICYWSYERLPKGKVSDGLLPTSPDAVFEVRSPSDRWTQVFTKVVEYLQAGVRVVVVLDEGTATASVYRPDEIQQVFDNGDDLLIPDVLPGFTFPVRRFFE